MPNWKELYERERERSASLELELRRLNEMIREDSMRALAEANLALKVATETIITLQKGMRARERYDE